MINQTVKLFIVAVLLLVPCMSFALPGAHDPDTGGYGFTCNSCHTAGKTVGNTDATYATNACLLCHTPGNPNTKKQFKADDFANLYIPTTVPQPILMRSSHKWFGADTIPGAGAQAPVDTDVNGLNKTGYPGNLACNRCHSVHGSSGPASLNAPYLRAVNDNDQMCRNCHRTRDVTDHNLGSHPVNVSYTSASVKAKKTAGKILPNPITNALNPTGQVKLVNNNVVCSTCHGIHNTDSRTSTFDPFSSTHTFGRISSSAGYLLRVSPFGKTGSDINICTNCHVTRNHNLGLKNSKPAVQCNDCHSAHVEYDPTPGADGVTPNNNLIRRYLTYTTAGRLSKRIVSNSTGNFNYYNANKTGVCQTCHTPPVTHFVGGSLSGAFPEPGHLNCAGCHSHAESATPVKGAFSYGNNGTCTNECHGMPPILSTYAASTDGPANGYVAAGGFNEATTPHKSHSLGGGPNANDFDCNECHKGADMENSKGLLSGSAVFKQVFVTGNTAGTIAATGGLTPTYTAGTATCNNVYCHSNGNGIWKSGMGAIAWGNNKQGTIIGQPSECTTCHDDPNASAQHTKHITGMGYGCVTCHAATVSNNTTLLASAKMVGGTHTNGIKNVLFSGVSPAIGTQPVGTTCSAVYCHSDGKGVYATATDWSAQATGLCNTCHKTATSAPALATGAHTKHFTFIGTNANCNKCHTYTTETAASHVNGTVNVDFTTTTGCGTNTCHGTIAVPTWTANYTGKDTCTKCHGLLSDTATTAIAANKYLFAPITSAGNGVGTGNVVSSNTKKGAHETHLRYLNGFSNYSTIDYRCASCHVVPVSGTAHVDKTSTPVFSKVANKWGALTPTYSGTNCSNTYCHNPSAYGTVVDPGTAPVPAWNDAAYIADGGKSLANCQKCHLVPGSVGFSKAGSHTGGAAVTDTSANQCNACHGHNGDTTGTLGKRHLDGIKYANGACDSCHGYPPVANMTGLGIAGNFENARLETFNGGYVGGGGHHTTHMLATVKATDGFTPCMPCHPDESSNMHHNISGTVQKANVNTNIATDTGYRFDDTRPKRFNTSTMTCSNVSCHFQPTTAW